MFSYAPLKITFNIIAVILGYICHTRHIGPLCRFSLNHQPTYLSALNITVKEIEAVLQLQLLLAQQLSEPYLFFKLSGSLTNTVNLEVVILEYE